MKHLCIGLALIHLLTSTALPLQPDFIDYGDHEDEGHKVTVAIIDLEGQGIDPSDLLILSDRLRAEVWKTGAFDVLERKRMNDILEEQGFQQTGACNDQSCMVEIGRLLPVDQIIGGSVGKVGSTWTLSLRLIDLSTGRIEKTAIKDCPRCTIDDVLSLVLGYAAEDLAGSVPSDLKVVSMSQRPSESSAAAEEESGAAADTSGMQTSDLPPTLPQTMAVKKGGGSIFSKWWFWGLLLAAGGGGAAAAMQKPADEAAGGGSDPGGGNGTITVTW